ncbi:MAG: hypothetical protein HOQ24_19170 [Mycobacteriaceae bacterium]|nr:hypothetical protein [Mycobacteriaceae bacterium]
MDVMPNTNDLRAYAREANSGQLVLDSEVAAECATACTNLLDALDIVKASFTAVNRDLPLGDFDCGKQLSTTMGAVANEFVAAIDQHVLAVKLIKDMVDGQVAALSDADIGIGATVAAAGANPGA